MIALDTRLKQELLERSLDVIMRSADPSGSKDKAQSAAFGLSWAIEHTFLASYDTKTAALEKLDEFAKEVLGEREYKEATSSEGDFGEKLNVITFVLANRYMVAAYKHLDKKQLTELDKKILKGLPQRLDKENEALIVEYSQADPKKLDERLQAKVQAYWHTNDDEKSFRDVCKVFRDTYCLLRGNFRMTYPLAFKIWGMEEDENAKVPTALILEEALQQGQVADMSNVRKLGEDNAKLKQELAIARAALAGRGQELAEVKAALKTHRERFGVTFGKNGTATYPEVPDNKYRLTYEKNREALRSEGYNAEMVHTFILACFELEVVGKRNIHYDEIARQISPDKKTIVNGEWLELAKRLRREGVLESNKAEVNDLKYANISVIDDILPKTPIGEYVREMIMVYKTGSPTGFRLADGREIFDKIGDGTPKGTTLP